MTAPSPPFDPLTIRKAIADALADDVTIPEGHRGAAVVFANGEKIQTALATRVQKGDTLEWDVGLVVAHSWTGEHANTFGVVNKITW